jgi:hypothetical protein
VTVLEDALREMFAARVDGSPAVGDPAGAAIRRARAVRRRRSAATSVAVGLALAITLSGAVTLREHLLPSPASRPAAAPVVLADGEGQAPEASPSRSTGSPAESLRRIGLDLRVGNQLWTTDGQQVPLIGVGLVTQVYRVPVGWVYGGAEHVRLLRTNGTSVELTSGDGRWVLSPDGRRLAYVTGRLLRVADVAEQGIGPTSSVPVPDGVTPVAFVGERVVIATKGGRSYDSLHPKGPYKAAWKGDVAAVYGAVGEAAAGLVRSGGRFCLATLAAADSGLKVSRTGSCELGLTPDSAGRLAPDGAWLAQESAAGQRLVEVAAALAGKAHAVSCPVRSTPRATWTDPSTLATADERGAVLCRTDGTQEVTPLPGGLVSGWQFVPRMAPPAPR